MPKQRRMQLSVKQSLTRLIDDEHMKRHQEMLSLKGEIEQYKMQIKSLCANVMKMVDNID